jgi:hypothetical protein
MSEDFLVSCQEKYGCGSIKLPFEKNEGYSYAPFVELKFILNGELLTVGNNSRPGKGNTAVIKSMQYGASEGMGVSIEIIDEEGGNFTKSFESINKGLGDIKDDIKNFELDFGWIVTKDCGSENYEKISVKNSGNGPQTGISILPIRMNVVYEGGMIKYTLEAQDMMSRVWETRLECNIGKDDHKITLKEAIRILAKTGQSPRFHVDFLKSDYLSRWDFKKDGDANKKGEGPLGVWSTNQQNKLDTIRNWIKGYVTEAGKGIVFQYMTKDEYIFHTGRPDFDEEAVLILLEDPGPDECKPIIDFCSMGGDFHLGTYIVNGGNKSPVSSFNPSVNWTFSPNSCNGGGAAPDSGEGAKPDGKKKCGAGGEEIQKDCGGVMVANVPHSSSEGNSSRASDDVEANAAHQKANAFREFFSPIEAELKIIGDPSYVFPTFFMTKTISLIVINPYHLRSTGEQGCPDWLAEPVCNSVFSNKNWMIMGVDHQINPGSYYTTLKLKLPAPGWDLPPDAPLGGQKEAATTEPKTKPEPKQCPDI